MFASLELAAVALAGPGAVACAKGGEGEEGMVGQLAVPSGWRMRKKVGEGRIRKQDAGGKGSVAGLLRKARYLLHSQGVEECGVDVGGLRGRRFEQLGRLQQWSGCYGPHRAALMVGALGGIVDREGTDALCRGSGRVESGVESLSQEVYDDLVSRYINRTSRSWSVNDQNSLFLGHEGNCEMCELLGVKSEASSHGNGVVEMAPRMFLCMADSLDELVFPPSVCEKYRLAWLRGIGSQNWRAELHCRVCHRNHSQRSGFDRHLACYHPRVYLWRVLPAKLRMTAKGLRDLVVNHRFPFYYCPAPCDRLFRHADQWEVHLQKDHERRGIGCPFNALQSLVQEGYGVEVSGVGNFRLGHSKAGASFTASTRRILRSHLRRVHGVEIFTAELVRIAIIGKMGGQCGSLPLSGRESGLSFVADLPGSAQFSVCRGGCILYCPYVVVVWSLSFCCFYLGCAWWRRDVGGDSMVVALVSDCMCVLYHGRAGSCVIRVR